MKLSGMRSKSFMITLTAILFSGLLFAQSPMQFNFQAVAREASGQIMSDMPIRVRISIRNESPNGNIEYSEVRSVNTNEFGMFNIAVGGYGANYSTGSLEDVQWGSGRKHLQIEVDPKAGNNYIDLGTTQLLSVPFALYALKTADKARQIALSANNGLSYKDSVLQIGSDEGNMEGGFTSNRQINLNNNIFRLRDGNADLRFSKGLLTIQQDSASDVSLQEGGAFMKVNPIYGTPDALPFLFTRTATEQHNGTTSPNEVVMWGHNLSGGGSSLIHGQPAIGYSLESNFKPTADDRLVESHEYYITPAARQIRLKSYTIDTRTDHIDFYHTSNNFYIKNPASSNTYFYLQGDDHVSHTKWVTSTGDFMMQAGSDKAVIFTNSFSEGNRILYFQNWDKAQFPGFHSGVEENRFFTRAIPEYDYALGLGDELNRFSEVAAYQYRGERMILKSGWSRGENMQATATVDLAGHDGSEQLRLRASYTPTSSADPKGETGAVSWDDGFIYIKTSTGWKRSALSEF
jgi:hypothetical protein